MTRDECDPGGRAPTARAGYVARLTGLQQARWKRVVDVQAPYRRHLRSLGLGRTLDVGCGIGRNLANLAGNAVGVDHNAAAVAACRARGYVAYTAEEFPESTDAVPGSFDALLFAHVLEHMPRADAVSLVQEYLPYVRCSGRVVMITPQERGFASDPTHVEFLDLDALREIAVACGLHVDRAESFPLPRAMGKWFTYNEFVLVATVPTRPQLTR